MEELPEWQCCGATFPLMLDDSMALIAPTRVLYQAQLAIEQDSIDRAEGSAKRPLATMCAICFNVLRRSQALLDRDDEMLERINWFTEQEYERGIRVAHLLEILRDGENLDADAKDAQRPWAALIERIEEVGGVDNLVAGMRVAPYYGCLLLRPHDEIGLDDPEDPSIMHDLLQALGAEPVDFPYNIECCGSYLAVKEPQVTEDLSKTIVASARAHGAQAIITACPLCQFNLDYAQRGGEAGATGNEIPILYFTQLMAMALGLPEADWGLEEHYVDPQVLCAGVRTAEAVE